MNLDGINQLVVDKKFEEAKAELLKYDLDQDRNIEALKLLGLCNVNQRIKLIFGEQYGISISADEDHTIVTLTQPIIEND